MWQKGCGGHTAAAHREPALHACPLVSQDIGGCLTLVPPLPHPAPPRPAPLRYVMPNVQAAQALSATLAAIFDVLNGALLLS